MKKKFYQVLCYFENGENQQFNINIYTSLINANLNQSVLIKTLMVLKSKNDLTIIPEKVLNMPHSEEFLGLVEMANLSCLNKYIYKGIDKDKIFEEYCSYLDYIKEAAINLYQEKK